MKAPLALSIVLFGALVSARAQSLEDVVLLGDRPACAMADLALMAPGLAESFPSNAELPARLAEALARYSLEKPLTKGRASLVVARSLKLRGSLMFLALPIERYAFRALLLDGVWSSTSSAADVMSGLDLLDFVALIGRKYGETP
jgi:hypothetical protein